MTRQGQADQMAASEGRSSAAVTTTGRATGRARDHQRLAVRMRELFGVRNIGAVYVLVAICIIFAIWVPSTFLQVSTVRQLLDSSALTALAALAIVVPLSARVFDLSFAYTMSLSGVVTAHFIVSTHLDLTVSILLGLGAALLVGFVNATVVVVLKIDSFIGTLATGSIIEAFITLVTGGSSITNEKLATGFFAQISQGSVAGFTLPVFYAIIVAAVLWAFLEHSATGRRIYATGFNPEAARLANIRIDRLRFCSLLVSALIAGFAGIVLASTISAGSPTGGTPYLLPAYAAAFVGATQLKSGRFNAWGTLIAVVMLGTGVIGLGLASAPDWASDLFTGVVLIAALGFTGLRRRTYVAPKNIKAQVPP
jgi:ribose/xylose/arabinose/galactoside ABC-type transport system permease subunit